MNSRRNAQIADVPQPLSRNAICLAAAVVVISIIRRLRAHFPYFFISKRTSSAWRVTPVLSKILDRWLRAVPTVMPSRSGAACRPSPLTISIAKVVSAGARTKRSRIASMRELISASGSETNTIAAGRCPAVQGIAEIATSCGIGMAQDF